MFIQQNMEKVLPGNFVVRFCEIHKHAEQFLFFDVCKFYCGL